MARTAPVPNMIAIPGMNPGTIVAGGGGGAGGGSGGSGKGGKDGKGKDGSDGGEDAEGGGQGGGDCGVGGPGGCTQHSPASRGDPVDLASGEVFTLPAIDLSLPGFVELRFERQYKSSYARQDVGMGHGWRHPFAWGFEVRRRKIRVTKGRGRTVDFALAPPGQPQRVGSWTLHREGDDFVIDTGDGFFHVFSRSKRQSTTYLLVSIEHESLPGFRLDYDEHDRLTIVWDSAGRPVRLSYHADGVHVSSLSVVDPNTQRTIRFAQYEYDEHANLVAVMTADGHVTRYAYDARHRLVGLAYPDGPTFRYVYDSASRCVESWGELRSGTESALSAQVPQVLADGRTPCKGIYHIRIEYHDALVEYFDSVRFQRFIFDDEGGLKLAADSGGATVHEHRNDNGVDVEEVTFPNGATWRTELDPFGQLARGIDPFGAVVEVKRDDFGRVIENVDPHGGVVKCHYDLNGNQDWIQDQGGGVTRYTYDENNLIVRRDDRVGGVTQYVPDAAGNTVAIVQPSGSTWHFEYDYFGRMLRRTDPLGGVVDYEYSEAGAVLGIRQASDYLYYTYDGMGNVTAVSSNEGQHVIRYAGMRWPYERVEPNGDTMGARYNREGWLVERINRRGESAHYELSSRGLVTRTVGFDGVEDKEQYDEMGRLVSRKFATESVEFERDLVGRIVAEAHTDGRELSFQFDLKGQLVHSSMPGGEVALDYNAVGKVTLDRQVVDGTEYTTFAEFDPHGRLIQLRSSLGHVQQIRRDVSGFRKETVLDGSEKLAHVRDALGRESAVRLPGGARIETRFDPLSRMVQRRVISGGPNPIASEPVWVGDEPLGVVLNNRYDYSDQSRLTRLIRSGGETRYEYDARGRLRSRETSTGEEEIFAADETSNVWETDPGARGRTYATGDRLISRGTTKFGYDERGRTVSATDESSGEKRAYAYNGQDQLEEVRLGDGRKVRFSYDAFGRRLRKRVTSRDGQLLRDVHFVWYADLLLHEVCVFPLEAAYTRTFAAADLRHQKIAQKTSRGGREGEWVYFVNDTIGACDTLIDGDGHTVGDLQRSAYGRTQFSARSTQVTPWRLPGQFEDEETGLFYNYHRYFDPTLGRYITPDPVGIAAGENPYVYCAADPINFFDETGLRGHSTNTSLTVRNGDSQGRWVPNSSGSRSPQNPSPGELNSGHTRDGRVHTVPGAAQQERQNGPVDEDSQRNTRARTQNTTQPTAHTEQHAIEWAERHFSEEELRDSHLKIKGDLPPCTMCNQAMAEFTGRHPGSKVTYKWPTNNTAVYQGGEGPRMTSADGPEERALGAAYRAANRDPDAARGQQEYYDAKEARERREQQAQRRRRGR